MTLGDCLKGTTRRLVPVSDQPRIEAEILIGHALGLSRSALIARDRDAIEWPEQAEALLRRREQGEPLAYVVGSQGFWTLDLGVTPDVLIPRADTETLVEAAIERLRCDPVQEGEVLDLGTGSGCIALSLAREFPHLKVTATDASPSALAVARRNAAGLNLQRVSFHCGDWFAAIPAEAHPKFCLILSNPPYIAEGDPHLAALSHEPRSALVAGPDGLDALRRIVDEAPRWLLAGGQLLLEHGYDQGAAVRELLRARGFVELATRPDLGGRDRVSGGRWP